MRVICFRILPCTTFHRTNIFIPAERNTIQQSSQVCRTYRKKVRNFGVHTFPHSDSVCSFIQTFVILFYHQPRCCTFVFVSSVHWLSANAPKPNPMQPVVHFHRNDEHEFNKYDIHCIICLHIACHPTPRNTSGIVLCSTGRCIDGDIKHTDT